MRLRQVALVARELDPVLADLCAVLGIEVAFRDPGVREFGLHNGVMPIGNTFLEVVSPLDADTAAGRLLKRRGGDGGYMVIFQTDELDATRAHLDACNARVVWSVDLPAARTIHVHPRDIGAAIVSFDQMNEWDAWQWAGPDWQRCVRTDVTQSIVGIEMQSADPAALAQRWAEVLALPVGQTDAGEAQIVIGEAAIRFVKAADGRGDGVGGIDVAVPDPERVRRAAVVRGITMSGDTLLVAGTRIRLRPA